MEWGPASIEAAMDQDGDSSSPFRSFFFFFFFSSSSLSGGVTLEVVMAQLERMDAHLNTLTSELYKVNTCVSRIAR